MQSEHTQKDDIINDATLVVATGCASIAGVKPVNEDAVAVHTPTDRHAMSSKGTAVVIADGVSSAEAGREASDYAVKHFIEEYFRTPDTWSAKQAGQKTLTTINLNLFKQSHEFTRQEKGYLCTFSGLVLKSRTAHFFHAGDSRIYRYRDGAITQLTRDHSINIGGGKNILARAVGMDNVLQVDYGKSVLEEGDIFLLTTDGVHDFINLEKLTGLLGDEREPQKQCERIIAEAKLANSDDNISCAIAKVDKLPAESRDDFNTKLTEFSKMYSKLAQFSMKLAEFSAH